ncbi:MAG: hypothetical protein KY476_03745 [Planctomycetes bacterium]|nr:hypothetical protein [Planctomycetota bacterium]
MSTATLSAELPTLDELPLVPLRGLLAYVSRCVKRVEGRFSVDLDHPDADRCLKGVEAAIRIAMDYAAGVRLERRRIEEAEADACQAVVVASEAAAWNQKAAFAANAAYAAVHAVHLALDAEDSEHPRVLAEQVLEAAATAVDAAVAADPTTGPSAAEDFKQLRRLELGRYPEPGQAIEPRAHGPLGPLFRDRRQLAEIKELFGQLGAWKADLERTKESLATERAAFDDERIVLKRRIAELEGERETLAAERADFARQAESLEQAAAEVEAERRGLAETASALDAQRRELQAAADEMALERREIEGLVEDLVQAIARRPRLTERLAEIEPALES